ncbi:MAG: antitoxin [Acidimicrobiales bacterium]
MRTTLDIDDDVLAAARSLARSERQSLGNVVSSLARQGLAPRPERLGEEEGFPVFAVPAGAPAVTGEMVQAALDER